jgi:hypothetical protein
MIAEALVVKLLARLWPVVFFVLFAMVVKAGTYSSLSLDGGGDLSGVELYGASLEVGDLLQVSNDRGRMYDVTIVRSKFSSLGNRTLSGTIGDNGTFVLIITADGEMQGSLAEGTDFYRIGSKNGSPLLRRRDFSAPPRPIDKTVPAPQLNLFEPTKQLLELNPSGIKTRSFIKEGNEKATAARGETIYPVYKADTVIDVLVYYDNKMATPETTVDYLLEYSNLAYDRTGIALTLNLAGLIPVKISSAQDNTTVLDLLRNRESPFTSADDDRETFNADLVHVLRVNKEDNDEENCGRASLSVVEGWSYRAWANGVTEWNPADGSGYYCSDRTFTHEIGHNLGALHNREEYEEPVSAAYSYSYGQVRSAVFATLMAYMRNGEAALATFSDPSNSCLGVPCGVPPSESNAADNKRTISNTKFIIASYEGRTFDYAAIQEKPYYGFCENETPFQGVLLGNSSTYTVEAKTTVFLTPDGSVFGVKEFDAGEFVLEPGEAYGWGFCAEGTDQPLGSRVTEVYFTYENPVSGEEIEGTHIFFDDAYEGDYGIVRAAAGNGGSVVGNPSVHARVDAEVYITFEPDYGYKLAEVTGTCPGSLHYNVYTAEPMYGDCWAVARFEELPSGNKTMERLKSLFDSVMSVRGK